jgi:guanosine-diphosphatase
MTQSRQARYFKAGGVLSLIILLYWFLSGSPSTAGVGNVGSVGNVYSSENSPTTKCTRSYDPKKPLVQYAIMIDAGSTGSRIHVYKFNNCGPTPELESEEFKMTEKRAGGGSGLSSYGEDAEGAAMSLDPLMAVALETVPDAYKGCSPVAVKATAGLRLLGQVQSANILEAVRRRLETQYPFPVVSQEKGGVEIMAGEDEGVYAWITTNYLLGKIGGPDKTPTAAIFDLGGGSTQIVFQPTFPGVTAGGMPETMAEGDHKYKLSFGGRSFELYQHSHLGYGLMAARDALHTLVVDKAKVSSVEGLTSTPILNPCITPGETKTVEVKFPDDHMFAGKHDVTMEGPVDALAAQCRALTEEILHKEASCKLAPCSFNGVHQPSLAKTFAREDVYIFSYFYDRTRPLGMPDSFTLRELHDLTAKVCAGPKHWSAFEGIDGALTELKDRAETCLDLNFMAALLHTGYDMPLDREVKIAKKIKGNELGWCLGASLPLLEAGSGWECKVRQMRS